MRQVVDARLDVFKPDNTTTTPDFTVPADDIHGVEIARRLQDLKDSGAITLDNTTGVYAESKDITTGDKLKFYTQLAGESSLTRRWTAVAHPPSYQSGVGYKTVEIEASDFVFSVLSWRIAFNSFESTQISGSSSAIVNTLLENNCPEIDRSLIQSVNVSTDYSLNGGDILEAMSDLGDRGDAAVYNQDESLVFKPLSAIETVLGADYSTRHFASLDVSGSDDDLANQIRVAGGQGRAIDDQQTTQDSHTTVTDSSRITHQISTRKSEVDRIELYTSKTGSDENFIVRLQKDENGSPVAIGDSQSDIVRRELDPTFVSDGGWTTFIFPEHTLPEANPWVIIETNGSSGQDIGVDSSTGNPAYKAYFPYPLIVRTSNRRSVDEYRGREARIKDDSLGTLDAAKDEAQSQLRHRSDPDKSVSATANSVAAHNLQPGDGVDATFPDLNLNSVVAVTERKDSYDGASLETTLEMKQVSSL